MIIYFAGTGCIAENLKRLQQQDHTKWGVLVSYKDQEKVKDGKGNKRFKELHQYNTAKPKTLKRKKFKVK